jgi:hypothetical protein
MDNIKKQVERAFRNSGRSCENPVTGDQFVLGVDPLAPQKRKAWHALRAREHFAKFGPAHLQPLPLSYSERETLKQRSDPELFILSWYARSVSARGFAIEDHPSFRDFARGVMAWEHTPKDVKNNKKLQERYPPRDLPGLGAGWYWRPPSKLAA